MGPNTPHVCLCLCDLIDSDTNSLVCFLAFRRCCAQKETTWPTHSDTEKEERMRRPYHLASILDLLIHHRYQRV